MSNFVTANFVPQLFSFILPTIFIIFLANASASIKTHSGHKVSLETVRLHVPHLADQALPTVLFEHNLSSNQLISSNRTISIEVLAPQLTRVLPTSSKYQSTSEKRSYNSDDKVYFREGNGYIFIFNENTHTLITAWGPDMMLTRVECSAQTRIFVNVAAGKTASKPRVDALNSTSGAMNMFRLKPRNYGALHNKSLKFQNESVVKREFQIIFTSDKSLLNHFCGNYNESNRMITALVKSIGSIFAATGITLTVEALSAATLNSKDPFALPNTVKNCILGNETTCSQSALLLSAFRSAGLKVNRRRDATVVVTGYGLDSGAVGAAYIAAACNRKYGWAWMQYTFHNKNVLAHELAHLLGALHDEEGIMRSAVDSDTEEKFSANTTRMISLFTEEVSSSYCLRKIDRDGDVGKLLFKVPSLYKDFKTYAHDITFAKTINSATTELALLFTDEARNLFFSILSSVERKDDKTITVGSWSAPISVPDEKTSVNGGGGIAFGNIQSQNSIDFAIAYIEQDASVKYRVCFNVSIDSYPSCKSWSPAYEIPVKPALHVQSVGITIKQTRNIGENDLIVALITEKKETFYEVGWKLNEFGDVEGRWSQTKNVISSTTNAISGFSVAAFDIEQKNNIDLIVYSSESAGKQHREYVRIGRNLVRWGSVVGGWTESIPAPKSMSEKVVGGGIDITVLPGDMEATTAIVQSASMLDSKPGEIYLDFSFNITAVAMANADGSLFENIVDSRSHGCLACYKADLKNSCIDRLKSCDDDGGTKSETNSSVKNIEKIFSLRQDEVDQGIYCTGFGALFVNVEGDTCELDSSRDNVVAKGCAVLMSRYLTNETNPEDTIDVVSYEVESDDRDNSEEIVVNFPGELADKGRPPKFVKLWLKPRGRQDQAIVAIALEKLKRVHDVELSFKDISQWKVEPKGGNLFLVRLEFSRSFQFEYKRNDTYTPYGI